MRIRPFIVSRDYDEISMWIREERVHAMWCANFFHFPLEKDNFIKVIEEMAAKFGDSPFVVTTDEGQLVGFFCYSLSLETGEGMFKFVVTNPKYRGKGYGSAMLRLAARYAFSISGAKRVHLNVFLNNQAAVKCYQAVGFKERRLEKASFAYKEELWDKSNMILDKDVP